MINIVCIMTEIAGNETRLDTKRDRDRDRKEERKKDRERVEGGR